MTHEISHQYDEILNAGLPGLDVYILYNCESQIVYDEDGEAANILTAITCTVNGVPADILFPEARHSQQAREFLARLRESARQALYAQRLRETTDNMGVAAKRLCDAGGKLASATERLSDAVKNAGLNASHFLA